MSYAGFLNRIALPVYSRLRGRAYSEHRAWLEKSQWWTPKELEEFQFAELQKLLKVAFESVPFYQKKYAEAGVRFSDIQSITDLKKLPPLERDELRNHREGLRNSNFAGRLLPHATGGSSGLPTQFYITRESFDWRMACTTRAYAWAGAMLGKPVVSLWGAPTGTLPMAKKLALKSYGAYRREFKINTFAQPAGFWENVVKQVCDYKPVAIVAYSANIERFCAAVKAANVRIPSLQSFIAAAEPVYPHMYDVVREALGVPLFATYGSREFMSIAVECEHHNGLHINSENILLENDERLGIANELFVTDLHNLGMPFIRYRIGDSAPLDPTPCPCGRGLPRLRQIDGRILDLLRTPEGGVVHAIVIPHTLKDVPEVESFQAQQIALDTIVIRVVLSGELSERSRDLFNSEMRKAFGPSMKFIFERVSQIPALPSGKRRVVIGLGGQ